MCKPTIAKPNISSMEMVTEVKARLLKLAILLEICN